MTKAEGTALRKLSNTPGSDDESQRTAQGLSFDCFKESDELAGSSAGTAFSDMALLHEKLRGDMRVWGFNVCLHSDNGVVTGFGLETATNFGNGEDVTESDGDEATGQDSELGDGSLRLTAGGQDLNKEDCITLRISDPQTDWVRSITVHYDAVIVGITLEVSNRSGSFGRKNANKSLKFEFSEEWPLIGIRGYENSDWMLGLGFITFDAVSEQCKYVKPVVVAPEETTEPSEGS